MKKSELKKILEENFPKKSSFPGDFLGEQVHIKSDVNSIMVTLDITLDVISQAINKKVDLIIAHHPMFFGDKDELLEKDNFLKSKYDILLKKKIGVFIMHTNADYNDNSIAYNQAKQLKLKKINRNKDNLSVTGELDSPMSAKEFMDLIKENLNLNNIEFRSNFNLETLVNKVQISSGASGSEIKHNSPDYLYIVGELKHHEWVMANERDIKVIEISHFSEKIFKDIILSVLKNKDIKLYSSEEENGYKIY